jgi:hypothetical protein
MPYLQVCMDTIAEGNAATDREDMPRRCRGGVASRLCTISEGFLVLALVSPVGRTSLLPQFYGGRRADNRPCLEETAAGKSLFTVAGQLQDEGSHMCHCTTLSERDVAPASWSWHDNTPRTNFLHATGQKHGEDGALICRCTVESLCWSLRT